jgi:hypothetical protein
VPFSKSGITDCPKVTAVNATSRTSNVLFIVFPIYL